MTYATMNGSASTHNTDGTLKLTSAGSNLNRRGFIQNPDSSMTSAQNGANGSALGYKLSSTTSYPSPQPAVTNDLVTLSSDTDFASYTAPTGRLHPNRFKRGS